MHAAVWSATVVVWRCGDWECITEKPSIDIIQHETFNDK